MTTYKKGDTINVSTNFRANEFDCPCIHCSNTLISSTLLSRLESMRSILGTKLNITSGYRCNGYQHELSLRGYETAKGISQHELGEAADVTNGVSLGIELEEAAAKAGFEAIGVGHNWIHVDTRGGKVRRWSYAKR